ncbi:hypothetical protein EYZ11_006494 [Aspergillus tanneri]|uniref:Uncharacterized protein n=1 Tax=Aspergillus tanneri TaxID=1220188 RepID=A0A4S3JFN5_9EURO|nr:hypothetical protein EYZ11_006494 [Aspergillus tanneri]
MLPTAINRALRTQSSYPTSDATKNRYALSQVEEPFFSVMQKMVYRDETKSLDDFMGDVEHYIDIHLLADTVNFDLQSVAQRRNEIVTQNFHRLLDLWDKAETPECERVKKLEITLLPGLSALYVKRHYTVREVLYEVRRVKEKAVWRPSSTIPELAGADSQFGPVAKRPPGWSASGTTPSQPCEAHPGGTYTVVEARQLLGLLGLRAPVRGRLLLPYAHPPGQGA